MNRLVFAFFASLSCAALFHAASAYALVIKGEGAECPSEPVSCPSAVVSCVSDSELHRICGALAGACAVPGRCKVFMSRQQCKDAGLADGGTFDLDRLKHLITDPTIPASYDEARARCELAHELTHLRDGCQMPSCQTESNASVQQAQCLEGFIVVNCRANHPGSLGWSGTLCEMAREAACDIRTDAAFGACRCRIGGPNSGDACAECVSECRQIAAQCNRDSDYNSAQCQRRNETYCDGKVVPTATPTPRPPRPTPKPILVMPPVVGLPSGDGSGEF